MRRMSNRLNELRIEKGYTYEELAKACSVDKSHICRFAQGTKPMSFELVCRIADVLGVSVDEIRDKPDGGAAYGELDQH